MKPCIGCWKCKVPSFNGICSQKDDISDILFPKIIDADAIIIGYCVFTGRECAQLATFFDRWSAFRRKDKSPDQEIAARLIEVGQKTGMVIGTWAYPDLKVDTYDHVTERILTVMNSHRVEPVEVISACGFGGLLHGFDDNHKAMILRYPEELEKVYQAGKSLVTGHQ